MANASSNKSGIRFTDKVWTPKGMKLLVDVLPKDCWAKAGDYVSVQTVIRLREKGCDEHKLEDAKVWKDSEYGQGSFQRYALYRFFSQLLGLPKKGVIS